MPTAHPPHHHPSLLINDRCRCSLFITIIITLVLPPATMVIAAGDLSSDRQALLDFTAAVPHPLSWKLNWTTNSSLCTTWAGVTCSTDANSTRVVGLRLPAAGFYGSVPANTLGRLDALSSLSLRSNRLYGTLPPDLLSLPSLRYLYFQHNNFSGDIPSSLSPHLVFLDLSFNSLTGNIPSAINNSTRLLGLNLQNNSLTGPLPDLFSLPALEHLNLSHNNFNGSIPPSLRRFPASSFQGNSLLCGSPLPRQCPTLASPSPAAPTPPSFVRSSPPRSDSSAPAGTSNSLLKGNSKSKLTTGSAVGIAVASCIVLSLLFLLGWMLSRSKRRKVSRGVVVGKTPFTGGGGGGGVRRRRQNDKSNGASEDDENYNELVFLQGVATLTLDKFDLDHLLSASADVLGKGTYGTTYKAKLQEGTTVAVKRLKQSAVGKMVFEQHIENVERVNHHPNVVPLRAYYYSKDEKLLVYDYAPLGDLYTLLHGNHHLLLSSSSNDHTLAPYLVFYV